MIFRIIRVSSRYCNPNGDRVKHGSDYEADYFPDVITNASLRFLRETKGRGEFKKTFATETSPEMRAYIA